MAESTTFIIGSAVHGVEGFLGEIESVDLDPTGHVATLLTIRPRHEGGKARLVPAAMLEADGDGLRLNCSPEQFEAYFVAADGSGG